MTTATRDIEEGSPLSSQTPAAKSTAPSRALVLTAFATVYVVWGSTYLAIRYAVETIPPFAMAGTRFLLAGAMMIAWAKWKDGARATGSNWRAAAIAGALLLAFGNGAVVWAEQRVPSGLTALLVAAVPLWMVLADWVRPGGTRPTPGVAIGVAVGIAGIVLLVGTGSLGGQRVDPVGAAALVFGSLSWAIGSLYSRTADLPTNPIFATGMEMFAGGAVLWIGALATGEVAHLDLSHASAASVTGFIYLVIFGSLIGFTAYAWLLRVSTPAKVSTYAFVNPVIAVLLGWAIAHEPVGARTIAAAAVIVGAVALITMTRGRRTADRHR
ncbi:MAG: EamA family transporter [Gemmatimonadaceae bacterium]